MPADKLGMYVMDIQQPYLKKALATFSLSARTIREQAGSNQETSALSAALLELESLISRHLDMEEHVLFPYFRTIIAEKGYTSVTNLPVPYGQISSAHLQITSLFKEIRTLSNDYTPPAGGSAALNLCYAQLFNFEQDMLKHFFLEEDILFPKLFRSNRKN